jgi:hypothetical protein
MSKKIEVRGSESRPSWDTLDEFVRARVQEIVQQSAGGGGHGVPGPDEVRAARGG